MIEPIDEKEARSDHHSRQGMRKPGDRAKKFSNKNTPSSSRPNKNPNSSNASGGSGSRTTSVRGAGVVEAGTISMNTGIRGEWKMKSSMSSKRRLNAKWTSGAKMIMEGAYEGTGPVTRG
ncbi:365_t:CDS:2, partial [Acaulospora colombiana]